MSISSIEVIKGRILTATKNSKIAVFKDMKDGELALDAVFDNTIATQKRIELGCEKYVGSYYGSLNINGAIEDMRKAI
jgi:hypothetical protein